jgi:hypothetical protein
MNYTLEKIAKEKVVAYLKAPAEENPLETGHISQQPLRKYIPVNN